MAAAIVFASILLALALVIGGNAPVGTRVASAPPPFIPPPTKVEAATGAVKRVTAIRAPVVIPSPILATAPTVVLPAVTLPAASAAGVTISPDNGSGYSQTFTIHYADAAQVEVDIHDANSHCDILIDTATGPARLPGRDAVCALDLSQARLSRGEVVLPLTFKPGFEGTKDIDASRLNAVGDRLEKKIAGHWTVGDVP